MAENEDKDRLADTNMENYGSKEHRDMRQEWAKKQEEWKGCGAEPGTEVWRIEKFKVIKQKDFMKTQQFFRGDSYIVLHTYKKDDDSEALLYNVHFWLGKETSQDEAGAAAIKTVEVDDLLGDLPVQYREVDGNESKLWNDLWSHFEVLEGGVDSGFRKVEKETFKPRLKHIRGKPKKMTINEVPCSVDSLNNNDAYVLDCGTEGFQFRPPNCNVWEKQACNTYLDKLPEKYNGRYEKHSIEWGDDTAESRKFWTLLGCEDGKQPDSLPDTSAYKQKQKEMEAAYDSHENVMFHITDENGELEINEVQKGKLDKSMLDKEHDDVLIIDVGRVVFIWVGKGANTNEIKNAMVHAQKYLAKTGRPMHTKCVRVIDGAEPSDFWKCFGCEKVPKDIC